MTTNVMASKSGNRPQLIPASVASHYATGILASAASRLKKFEHKTKVSASIIAAHYNAWPSWVTPDRVDVLPASRQLLRRLHIATQGAPHNTSTQSFPSSHYNHKDHKLTTMTSLATNSHTNHTTYVEGASLSPLLPSFYDDPRNHREPWAYIVLSGTITLDSGIEGYRQAAGGVCASALPAGPYFWPPLHLIYFSSNEQWNALFDTPVEEEVDDGSLRLAPTPTSLETLSSSARHTSNAPFDKHSTPLGELVTHQRVRSPAPRMRSTVSSASVVFVRVPRAAVKECVDVFSQTTDLPPSHRTDSPPLHRHTSVAAGVSSTLYQSLYDQFVFSTGQFPT